MVKGFFYHRESKCHTQYISRVNSICLGHVEYKGITNLD